MYQVSFKFILSNTSSNIVKEDVNRDNGIRTRLSQLEPELIKSIAPAIAELFHPFLRDPARYSTLK